MMKMMKWEWMRMKRNWLYSLCLEALGIIVIGVLYVVAKKSLFKVVNLLYGLPINVYALLGLEKNTETGNILFFLIAYLAVVTAWNMWKSCESIVEGIHMDEKTNVVQLFCGQGISRTEVAATKFLAVYGGFVVKEIILGVFLLVCTIIMGGYLLGVGSILGRVFGLIGKSIMVAGMFLAIAYLYAVFTDKSVSGIGNWVLETSFFGTWIVGNLYRVKNVIFDFLSMYSSENSSVTEQLVLADGSIVEQVSTKSFAFDVSVPKGLEESLAWLDNLGRISPLSWINPFRPSDGGIFLIKCLFCLVVMCGCVVGAIWYYRNKRSIC